MKALLVYLPRHIDILQTPSPLFGFDERKTRDVISFSSLDVFVSFEQLYLKVGKKPLERNFISVSHKMLTFYELSRKLGKEDDTSGKPAKYAK